MMWEIVNHKMVFEKIVLSQIFNISKIFVLEAVSLWSKKIGHISKLWNILFVLFYLKKIRMFISNHQQFGYGLTFLISFPTSFVWKFGNCVFFDTKMVYIPLFTVYQVWLAHLVQGGRGPHQLDSQLDPSFDPKYLENFLEPDSELYQNVKSPKYWHVKDTVSLPTFYF